jgi:superfamily II DNA/RNA helicase
MEGFLDEVAVYDDEQLAHAEDDATARCGRIQVELADTTQQEIGLLKRMEAWAARYEATPDAKARQLITYLKAVCRPDGQHWTNERVVVFTEYRDTQIWLKELLAQDRLGGDAVRVLYGGMDAWHREQLRLEFQEPPNDNPVRILLATDAASEGIDLHEHCHRLINYDIPFNPNKLEQRIGRIDRYGQPHTPEVRHFVGAGWQQASDSYEADLEFLARVAAKVARMEEDLGSVNEVLADAVQKRMLGASRHRPRGRASAAPRRGSGIPRPAPARRPGSCGLSCPAGTGDCGNGNNHDRRQSPRRGSVTHARYAQNADRAHSTRARSASRAGQWAGQLSRQQAAARKPDSE